MNNWIAKDLQCIWHPYTQMKDHEQNPPILIEKAKGIKIYDQHGNFYYDTISSWWCNVHGHNHPYIKAAIKKQLDSLEHVLFSGFTHKPAIKLSEKLINLTPKRLTKVFFSDNGSTSVEVALKMSFQYWHNSGKHQKTKFACLDHAYHGDTVGAMSVGGLSIFNKVFRPLMFSSYRIPSPYCYRCPLGKEQKNCGIACIKFLDNTLKKNHKEICALILEPLIMGAGGMIIYPKDYLKRARELTKKYGVHLILDEVATGFGRTGKMFALEHAKVSPDFLCLSKGLTSGYLPLSATLTTESVYKTFYADYQNLKTFYHGHTYTANPLSTAAALAAIELFEKEDTLSKVNKLIPFFKQSIEEMRDLPFVGDTRSLGLVGALELVKNKKTKQSFDLKDRIGYQVYKKALQKNILLRPLGNIIYLFLPLCIKKDQLKKVLKITKDIIKEI